MKAGDHVILHECHRRFAEGRTGRLPLEDCAVMAFLSVGCLGFSLFFAAGAASVGLSWSVLGVGGVLIVLIFVGATVFFVWATVSTFRDRARLQAHGRLLTGEVTHTAEERDWVPTGQGGFVPLRGMRVFYRFLTPAGDERVGDVWISREHYIPRFLVGHRPMPAQGDLLAILYADGAKELVL